MTAIQIAHTKNIILEHKDRLSKYLSKFIISLVERSVIHDNSKFDPIEFEPYAYAVEEFKKHPFGTEGYDKIKESLGEAVTHHYANNRHHPEHFETGINEMDLVDLLEMLADWKAASQNQTNGSQDLMKSISIQTEKYGISPQLRQILINTAKNYGMI